MALPDTLERAGIVLGSVVMLGIPVSFLAQVLVPLDTTPFWVVATFQFVPAAAIGVLVAYGRLPVTYDEVWRFGIAFWAVAVALGAGLGLNVTGGATGPALRVWLLAVAVAGVVATYRRWLPGAGDRAA